MRIENNRQTKRRELMKELEQKRLADVLKEHNKPNSRRPKTGIIELN